ncbi:hypothetical protein N7G274_004591 [Stereocaulon virgatum]|uniref:Uncharacterized protein n=1 Tax=Stereocaulon virgatum TaxID=373712 RepID=A0ABR4ADB3_9LECA
MIASDIDAINRAPKEVEDILCAIGDICSLTFILRDASEERAVISFDGRAQKHIEDLEGLRPIIRSTLEKIVAKLHQ